ncbi:MAG TPA: dephospho-CoA kinase [Chloroflexota bacterium]|nr:dephospho-CoA kinase [Chloroflexota bacterium]
MPYIIGLTGNIGAGKSEVVRVLRELGAESIDADRLGHEVMAPGTPEWERLVARFGRDILQADDTVDRRKLGAIVFADPAALADLERIVHPGVRARIRARFAATERPVIVVEAIKLLESGLYLEVDAVWVVVAAREVRVRRLVDTRGLTVAEAEMRVDAQTPEADKVARADVVIENSGDRAALRAQVVAAWQAVEAGTAPRRRGEPR